LCLRYMYRDGSYNRLCVKLNHIAVRWIKFICDSCIPSDRKTFRWVVMALEFAMTVNRGNNIFNLSEEDFCLLRSHVSSCMALLISNVNTLATKPLGETKEQEEETIIGKKSSNPSAPIKNQELSGNNNNDGGNDNDDVILNSAEESSAIRKEWISSLNDLESRRSLKLHDQGLVGKVLDDQPENR